MNVKNNPNTLELINSKNEKITFPIPEDLSEVKQVYLNGRELDINVALEMANLKRQQTVDRDEIIHQDNKRTRQLVRGFGFSAMFVACVAIVLGSYLVHAENKDMVKIDAIYNRISAVEASPYNVGDIVCFKLLDTEASKDKSRVLGALKIDTATSWPGLQGDFIPARGEIVEHYQTKAGTWFAKIAISGVFARTDKTKFLEAKRAVICSVEEVRLSKALKQKKLNKID